MKITESSSLVITDPCYISKDKDWGRGEIFDWENCRINSPIFTNYLWLDGMPEVVSDVVQVRRSLNEVGLINLLNDHVQALKNYGEALEEDFDKAESDLRCIEDKVMTIGSFTTDAGCIGVFLLNEVLKYNPGFETELCNKKCYTIINDFTGRIIVHDDIEGESQHILGLGNKTFYSI